MPIAFHFTFFPFCFDCAIDGLHLTIYFIYFISLSELVTLLFLIEIFASAIDFPLSYGLILSAF